MSTFCQKIKKVHKDIDTFFNKRFIISTKKTMRIILFATIIPCYITYKYTDWHWRYVKMSSAKIKWQHDKDQALRDLTKKLTQYGATH